MKAVNLIEFERDLGEEYKQNPKVLFNDSLSFLIRFSSFFHERMNIFQWKSQELKKTIVST